jgi:formylglycine-generating enzyme required for sulfatase activity
MGINPSEFKNCEQCPVEQVWWDDAREYIRKLNSQTNDRSQYRLPTEAEWEYAGDLDSMGWYSKNSGNKTHSVGSKSANRWRLYDMHGNVWEVVARLVRICPVSAVGVTCHRFARRSQLQPRFPSGQDSELVISALLLYLFPLL